MEVRVGLRQFQMMNKTTMTVKKKCRMLQKEARVRMHKMMMDSKRLLKRNDDVDQFDVFSIEK